MKKKYTSLLLCAAFAVGAQAADEAASAKVDVLGRHVSNVRNMPKAYVKDVGRRVDQTAGMKDQKSLSQRSLMKAYPSEPQMNHVTSGSFEYWSNSNGAMVKKYTYNGEEVGENAYKTLVNLVEDSDYPRIQYKNSHFVNYSTSVNENRYNVRKTINSCTGQETCQVNEVVDGTFRDSHGYLAPQYDLIDFWKYTTVAINSNLYNDFIRPGNPGLGIGIAVAENGVPLNGIMKIVPSAQYEVAANCHDATPAQVVASSRAVRTINSLASRSKIYVYDRWCDNTSGANIALPVNGYDKNPKIYVGNLGFGVSNENDETYGTIGEHIDNFIYNTRTIEVAAAGNAGFRTHSSISPAGKAINAITVGAVHNDLTYHYTSSAKNPKFPGKNTTYVKPEIANYSDLLFPKAGVGAVEKGSAGEVLTPYAMQTASAAAYTTASIALLLKKYPFYKWHPEVVKALLLTSSVTPISNASSHDADNYNVAGIPTPIAVSVPNARNINNYNRSRYWNGNNGDFFNSDDEIVFTETNIKPNQRYRIAISWLVNGTFVVENGVLPLDLDLMVYETSSNSYNWSSSKTSTSGPNAFELVDFTTKSNTGKLKIVIKRFSNHGGRVLLGYNLSEVH